MADVFESVFGYALDAILRVEGETCTVTYADGTTTTVTDGFVFNEQVGFVDDRRRAVFTFKAGVLSPEADRAQYIVLSGETDRWHVVDVRNDKSGGIEVRADGTLKRL